MRKLSKIVVQRDRKSADDRDALMFDQYAQFYKSDEVMALIDSDRRGAGNAFAVLFTMIKNCNKGNRLSSNQVQLSKSISRIMHFGRERVENGLDTLAKCGAATGRRTGYDRITQYRVSNQVAWKTSRGESAGVEQVIVVDGDTGEARDGVRKTPFVQLNLSDDTITDLIGIAAESGTAIKMLLRLVMCHMDHRNLCQGVTIPKLAREMNITRATAYKALRLLKAHFLVSTERVRPEDTGIAINHNFFWTSTRLAAQNSAFIINDGELHCGGTYKKNTDGEKPAPCGILPEDLQHKGWYKDVPRGGYEDFDVVEETRVGEEGSFAVKSGEGMEAESDEDAVVTAMEESSVFGLLDAAPEDVDIEVVGNYFVINGEEITMSNSSERGGEQAAKENVRVVRPIGFTYSGAYDHYVWYIKVDEWVAKHEEEIATMRDMLLSAKDREEEIALARHCLRIPPETPYLVSYPNGRFEEFLDAAKKIAEAAEEKKPLEIGGDDLLRHVLLAGLWDILDNESIDVEEFNETNYWDEDIHDYYSDEDIRWSNHLNRTVPVLIKRAESEKIFRLNSSIERKIVARVAQRLASHFYIVREKNDLTLLSIIHNVGCPACYVRDAKLMFDIPLSERDKRRLAEGGFSEEPGYYAAMQIRERDERRRKKGNSSQK